YQHLELDSYESDGIRPVNIRQNNFDLFPAVNLSYAIKEKHIFRIVYGKTINRPEFREIAPYVYYDFESFSYYEGNTYLENAKIHNVDFRYEFYPQTSEMISIGAFYKQFVNPIEMTYFYAGGQMQYTYMNAHSAYSVGIEIDIRKSLDFMKLKNFSIVLNTSFLKSEVVFPENSVELNRPMQGQSPYIVNAGLYYDNSSLGLTFSILYNIAGKRIVAVGQANQNANENIPNTYEMPRHSLDLSIQKQFGRCTVKLGAKNILCQKIILSQLGSIASEHEVRQYSQETKVVNSGLQINVGVSVKINK
ncbi:MAG: TonB-dependent receptor, partial [Bacteroidales bacterium]